MQPVLEINTKRILKAAKFRPRLGLAQLRKAEKSSRSPEYLSRAGCGTGHFTGFIAFLPGKNKKTTKDT